MNIVILDYSENFIQFLDVERTKIIETHSKNGLRSIDVEYTLDDLDDEIDIDSENITELFKIGNKIFISGHDRNPDYLYVIDTQVTKDYFKENTVTFTAEDVLVELNFAPLFSQVELTTENGFNMTKVNGEWNTKVDHFFLNYWFGDYFNIGILQNCLSEKISKIAPTGTMTLMELLRFIEEKTQNVFIPRYEKDLYNNTIHRFLDFLNPNDADKSWETNFKYIPPVDGETHTPSNTYFRLLNENNVLYEYSARTLGIDVDSEDTDVQIKYQNNALKFTISKNNYSAVVTENVGAKDNRIPSETISSFMNFENITVPKNSIFEIRDKQSNKILFRHEISPNTGKSHTQVLDLGYNVENIEIEFDENDSFEAIAPIIKYDKNNSESSFTRGQVNTIITNWQNLEVNKGDTIPMIVQRVTDSHAPGASYLAQSNVENNYYVRPLKPQDNENEYEYFKGTAYWKAPFTKHKGDLFVEQENESSLQYHTIRARPDITDTRGVSNAPKCGTLETTQENPYIIYNEIVKKLAEKSEPTIDVKVDVANLKGNEYNNFSVYDTVYLKIPNHKGLIAAEVTKTSKNLHDMAANTVELSNFQINSKVSTIDTVLFGEDVNVTYPKKGVLKVSLEEEDSDNVVPNKLVNFSFYKVDDQSTKFLRNYTKTTDANGKCNFTIALNPGNYLVEINFPGDVEYSACSASYNVNIAGKVVTSTTTSSKNKTTQATTKKKTVKQYWTKCGLSPNKKEIVAVAKHSGYEKYRLKTKDVNGKTVKSATWYKTVFKNYCPICKKSGKLRYDGQKRNGCITSTGAYGKGYKTNIPEHEITCASCDADYDGVTGYDKATRALGKLKMVKKPVKSSESERNKLRNGKLLYGSKTVTVKANTTQKEAIVRVVKNTNITKTVKNKARAIVGNHVGYDALKDIVAFMDDNIKYSGYSDFKYSAKYCLKKKRANCCDGTRLFFELCDAAGLTEYYQMYYIHVHEKQGHVYAVVKNKKTGKKHFVDCASDSHTAWNYVCIGYSKKTSPDSTYPKRPF